MSACVPLTAQLKKKGYRVFGTGKVYHRNDHQQDFEDFGVPTNYGPHPVDGIVKYMGHHPAQDHGFERLQVSSSHWNFLKWEQTFGPLEHIPDWSHLPKGKKGWTLYGRPWNIAAHGRDPLPDEDCVSYAEGIFRQQHQQEQPFALFCGFVRSHTPLYAPQSYFDRFPLDGIQVPPQREQDLEDCAQVLSQTDHYGFLRYQFLKHNRDQQWYKKWLQAYLACVSFVDDQVGALMLALEKNGCAENTMVVFTSDHGFHMGEKGFLYKQSLWEPSTRVPLLIRGPWSRWSHGERCDQAVSLVDLYPTIVEALNLGAVQNPEQRALDGHSLLPLLEDPKSLAWAGPKVALTVQSGIDHTMDGKFVGAPDHHFSVRSKRYRYTLCSNGEEELYDHAKDEGEHNNLADSPEHKSIKAELRAELIRLRRGKGWLSAELGPIAKGCVELGHHDALEFQMDLRVDVAQLKFSCGSELIGRFGPLEPFPEWNHLRARRDGQRVEFWLNGELRFSCDDAVSSPGLLSLAVDEGRLETQSFEYRKL